MSALCMIREKKQGFDRSEALPICRTALLGRYRESAAICLLASPWPRVYVDGRAPPHSPQKKTCPFLSRLQTLQTPTVSPLIRPSPSPHSILIFFSSRARRKWAWLPIRAACVMRFPLMTSAGCGYKQGVANQVVVVRFYEWIHVAVGVGRWKRLPSNPHLKLCAEARLRLALPGVAWIYGGGKAWSSLLRRALYHHWVAIRIASSYS